METRGKIILISLFILTIFFTGCKKDDFFDSKKDSKNQSYYDDFNKSKKEKEKEKPKQPNYSCSANDHDDNHSHGRKITICHNGHMITISVNAVLKHFNNHSTDKLFACDGSKSIAYSDIECTLNAIMAQKHFNPNSQKSLQRAFNIWIDEYFLAGKWPSAKVNCNGSTGDGTTGGTTDPGTTTGGGTTTDPGTTTGGGTTGGTTDPGTTTGGGTTTDPGTTTGGTTDPGTTTTPPTPTIPVCHNGAILDQDYLTAYVNSQDGDLLIACEFAAGAVSYYDIEGPLLDIIYDYGLDANAPDVMFQAFVIWYEDYYKVGNWPPDAGGAGSGAGDGGSGTGTDGTVIISN